jgi:hypothetical protein
MRATRTEVAGLDWSGDRLLPTFQPPEHLDVYDIRSASHELQLSVTTMVGLINRPKPQVYLLSGADDDFWLTELLGSLPKDTHPASGDSVLHSLLSSYRKSIQGMIIYDPTFPDSINIATMLAGQHEGFLVTPAQAQDLQAMMQFPVLADLRTQHWRNRLQAYRWAQQFLNNCSGRLVAGLHPEIATGLRSFLVATRTFVYFLDSRNFLPDLANNFKSERSVMHEILSAFSAGTVHLGWFIDEPSGVGLTSKAAIPVLATDFATNLEVWTSIQASLPPKPSQVQSSPDASQVYVSFTISDGDNLQYNQHRLLRLWHDPARGSVPLGWTISPVLIQAAPSMAAYYLRTATPNDEFIAGPSGAGYMFPSSWPAEHLPAFLQRTGELLKAMNLSLLEVLDSSCLQSSGLPLISLLGGSRMALTDQALQKRFVQALSPFGLGGLLSGAGSGTPGWSLLNNTVPIYQNLGLADSVSRAIELIKHATSANQRRPLFLNVYLLAWTMTPLDVNQVVQQLGSDYQVVTPGALLALLAQAQS